MYAFLLVIHVIVSLFLIFIILIQSSKGEGLADVFGGGSQQSTIFGTRTGNFLTQATTASAIIFMITCLSLAFLSRQRGASVVQQELIKEQTVEKIKQNFNTQQTPETAKEQAVETKAPAPVTSGQAPTQKSE